jgi:putative FmdB family regulatory protein
MLADTDDATEALLIEGYAVPTYEFFCATCGLFEQRRSLKEASDPMTCPACQVVAQRIYSTSGVILTSGAGRRRLDQSPEPKVVTRQIPEEPTLPRTLQQSARSRPWQLGHAAPTTPVKPGLQRI